MSKHRYDGRKRPGNCAFAQHFFDAKEHDPEKDMRILVLQTGLSTEAEREYHKARIGGYARRWSQRGKPFANATA